MFSLLFKAHFVPQFSLERGGTGVKHILSVLFRAREELATKDIELPREQMQCQRLKITKKSDK